MLAILAFGVCRTSAAEQDEIRKLTSAERTAVAEGAARATITSLADGSLGLVYP